MRGCEKIRQPDGLRLLVVPQQPSLIDEITRMRFELLGTSIIPQHSDGRVLDQLLYKWDHSRQ